MKRYSVISYLSMSFLWLIFFISTTSLATASEWTKTFDGYAKTMDATSDGGFIVAAENQDDIAFLMKLSESGEEEWRKTFHEDITIRDVHQTSDGGYIVAGYYYNPIRNYAYVCKLNSSGVIQWERTFSASSGHDTEAYAVREITDGGFIIAGETGSTLLLLKLNSNGQTQWLKLYEDYSFGKSIEQTSDGGYILESLKTSEISRWFKSHHIMKLDSSGNLQWEHLLCQRCGFTIQQIEGGGYMVAGTNQALSCLNEGAFLIKLNSSGDEIWQRFYLGYEGEIAFGNIEKTLDGGYIVSGKNYSRNTGNTGAMILKFNANDQIEWQKSYVCSTNYDWSRAVQATDGGYGILIRALSDRFWILKTDAQGHIPNSPCNETDTQYSNLGFDIPLSATKNAI